MFAAYGKNTEAGIARRQTSSAEYWAEKREQARRRQEAEYRAQEMERLAQKQARLESAIQRTRSFRAALAEQGLERRFTYSEIEQKAIQLFGCTKTEIRGLRRHREIVLARQFVMYWTVRLTRLSLPQVGRLMGGRDHTTVLSGYRAYRRKRAAMGRTLRPAR